MAEISKSHKRQQVCRRYSATFTQKIGSWIILFIFIMGFNMQTEPSRPLLLLKNAGILLHLVETSRSTGLGKSINVWAYSTSDNRVMLWIYEYEGQSDIDDAIAIVEAELSGRRRILDFAQNGEFLLVASSGENGEFPRDKEIISRIVQAFSGSVEH